MIAVQWDNNTGAGGLVLGASGLMHDAGHGTSILISLFTDRRASADQVVGDQRGWPGDALAAEPGDRIGSWLFLLKREKATEETRLRAIDYTAEALEWMVTTGLLSGLEVEAEWVTPEMLGIRLSWIEDGRRTTPMVLPLRVGRA